MIQIGIHKITQDYTIHNWHAHHEVCIHSYLNLGLFMQHASTCYNRMRDPTQLVVEFAYRICRPRPSQKTCTQVCTGDAKHSTCDLMPSRFFQRQ